MVNPSVPRRALLSAGLLLSAAVAFFVLTRFRVLSPSFAHPPSELRALAAFPYDDWEAVLQRYVDERGNVDANDDRLIVLVGCVIQLRKREGA